MSEPSNYGRTYWCVKTNLSKDGEIYVHADRLEMREGTLFFFGSHRREESDRPPGPEGILLMIAAGHWRAVYAASGIDGSAVAVQHWEGEVIR
jgi:hypothetical protein